MEIKRTHVMTVETRRQVVVRQSEADARGVCPQCAEQTVSAETAAVLFNLGCRLVYRLVEQGEAHFAETEAGAVMICLASLAAIKQMQDAPRLLPADAAN